MPLNCVIIDDDNLSIEILQQYCSKIPDVKLVKSFTSPQSAIKFLHQEEIDLLLLDVMMPEINGFNLLDRMLYSPSVILTTSEQDYAFLGFEYAAIDFLKKPVKFDRFKAAINKAVNCYTNAQKQKMTNDLFIRQDGELIKIPLKQIDFIQAVGDYIRIHADGKTYLVQSTLKNIEEKLDAKFFIKSHRSFIVNIEKVDNIVGQKLLIQDKTIPFSRTHKPELFKKLNIL